MISKASEILEKDKSITDNLFLETMSRYLHNRIGTSINYQEHKFIDNASAYIDTINYNKGELVCYIDDSQQQPKFALYLGNNKLIFNVNDYSKIKENISSSEIKKLTGQINQRNSAITDLSKPPLATYSM